MQVLYVIRDRSERSPKKRLHRWATGFVDGQDGFFEAALHRAARVTRRTLEEVRNMSDREFGRFDALVVNGKCGLDVDAPAELAGLAPGFDGARVLFLGAARPEVIPGDEVLDGLACVFKREPFADLGRYDLSPRNAEKIRPTNLSNPLVSHHYRWPGAPLAEPPRWAWKAAQDLDLSFIGTVSEQRYQPRVDAWEAARGSTLSSYGGLVPKPGISVPAHLEFPEKLPKQAYLDLVLRTRVNLAIEGIGPFTFRHLELFWAGAFCLSSPSSRELWLRAPLVEGQDYIAFDTTDEMIDLARYYVEHDAERHRIGRAGRAAYERLYDVEAHAREVAAGLRGARETMPEAKERSPAH